MSQETLQFSTLYIKQGKLLTVGNLNLQLDRLELNQKLLSNFGSDSIWKVNPKKKMDSKN